MKKKAFTITATLLLSVFALLSMMNQVQAQDISATWVGYRFSGSDSFYGTSVVAYETGSTAVLYVSVTHNNFTLMHEQMNVSEVGISLHWGDIFISTQSNITNPVALKYQESRIFTITFTVPNTANASNLFLWDYEVYMEHVNATGAINGTRIETRANLGLPHFVVYSATQASSKQIATTIAGVKTALGFPIVWSSARAGILWMKAMNETSVADNYYKLGEFSNADTHYKSALNLIGQAFTAEETVGVRAEDASLMLAEAQVKYYEGWSNLFNGLSNMWTLIGVALILFALGYIIRGLAMLRRAQGPL